MGVLLNDCCVGRPIIDIPITARVRGNGRRRWSDTVAHQLAEKLCLARETGGIL
jgi:hypothetical protein